MITKDEVIKLAKECGASIGHGVFISTTDGDTERTELHTFREKELLAFANATAERVSDKQDAEILTGDPSEFFRSRDVADAVRAKWLNKGGVPGISYVATLKFDDETRVVRGVIPDDKE